MMTIVSRLHATRRLCAGLVCGALGLAGLGLGGCNSQNTALMEANRALTDRVTDLTQENESLKNLVHQLQGAVSARDKAIADMQLALNDARAGNMTLANQLGDLQGRFGDLKFGSLDPTTDTALAELARQHPDMLEYDSARGLLRFKADFTFDSGSDLVKESAKGTLSQLAQILNSSATSYDIRVVGHTDTQRLSPDTARKHTTNLRLSADRAISVRNELTRNAVDPQRVEICGRGEFDPMVANLSNGNTPQNRRVEIYLTKPTRGRVAVSPVMDTPPMAPAGAVKPGTKADSEIMK